MTCEARFQTLGPNQALTLLNSDFANQLASELVEQLGEPETSNDQFAAQVIDRVLRRPITAPEQMAAASLMSDLSDAGLDLNTSRRLYALSVMNWNEFLFLD